MDQQGKTSFKNWSTQELREWTETAMLLPEALTIHIFDNCLQAVEELNLREGIYAEPEMLH